MDQANASHALAANNEGLFRFDYLNFAFRAPAAPWEQEDPRTYGRSPVLAFARSGPITLTVCASKLEPGYVNPTARVVELSRMTLRKAATTYRVLREEEEVHNGLKGWQTETAATVQGHELYFVEWDLAANGFGYQVTVWGPADSDSDIRNEANEVFPDFELITHAP